MTQEEIVREVIREAQKPVPSRVRMVILLGRLSEVVEDVDDARELVAAAMMMDPPPTIH